MSRAILSILVLPLFAACGAPSTASSSAAEVRVSTDPAQRGEACGSDVAIQRDCAAGLTCVVPDGGPISEHTPGICLPAAGEGEACSTATSPSPSGAPKASPACFRRAGRSASTPRAPASPPRRPAPSPTSRSSKASRGAPGCGAFFPGGTACYSGLELTTKQYIDLHTVHTESIDNAAHSGHDHARHVVRDRQPLARRRAPETIEINSRGLTFGGAFEVIITRTPRSATLWSSSITPSFAP